MFVLLVLIKLGIDGVHLRQIHFRLLVLKLSHLVLQFFFQGTRSRWQANDDGVVVQAAAREPIFRWSQLTNATTATLMSCLTCWSCVLRWEKMSGY